MCALRRARNWSLEISESLYVWKEEKRGGAWGGEVAPVVAPQPWMDVRSRPGVTTGALTRQLRLHAGVSRVAQHSNKPSADTPF
ncbi:hypothetical protein RRG08_003643 [Elysia crispata]|uniref:Uncharacterized protein n=1 Tax=Elysia crispata TaxID=231223 RepID=A0AAE1E516_9GAST|nr:hypothetical protein RRG08_003643 [Elysia crispata]